MSNKLTDLEKLWDAYNEEVNSGFRQAMIDRVEEIKLYVPYTITEIDE